ncbi:MAG TPA: hypothetical protein G4O04_05120 [Anaerolineae bacterium]|nr:hypothetical protein [Anaerolineae bacterium]HID84929.1 hypothetical protein [Anaerolineales bacterium]HIQ08326.1 hypothetical protein [Anaerolineaceae bacterium]
MAEFNPEQILQRMEWLEQERRKDRTTIASLQERLVALEGELRGARDEVKGLNDEVAHLKAMLAKMDHLEARLAEHEEAAAARLAEQEERIQASWKPEVEWLKQQVEDLQTDFKRLEQEARKWPSLESRLAETKDTFNQVNRRLAEVEYRMGAIDELREEQQRTARLLQEAQDRETRRLSDLQGEVSALRKRLEERLGQLQLLGEQLQKVEIRIGELRAAEDARLQEQQEFIESQMRQQIDRERMWKQWEARFGEIERLSQQMEAHVEAWQETLRNLRQAEQRFEEMTERLDRRIREITEMQRLAEDRFRQEWHAFKADDQKRWANYVLAQEEKGRDLDRRLEKLHADLARLQEQAQMLTDLLNMSDEQTRKRLQALVALAQEWLQDYERTLKALR